MLKKKGEKWSCKNSIRGEHHTQPYQTYQNFSRILRTHTSDIRPLENNPVTYYKCKHRHYPVLFKGMLPHL